MYKDDTTQMTVGECQEAATAARLRGDEESAREWDLLTAERKAEALAEQQRIEREYSETTAIGDVFTQERECPECGLKLEFEARADQGYRLVCEDRTCGFKADVANNEDESESIRRAYALLLERPSEYDQIYGTPADIARWQQAEAESDPAEGHADAAAQGHTPGGSTVAQVTRLGNKWYAHVGTRPLTIPTIKAEAEQIANAYNDGPIVHPTPQAIHPEEIGWLLILFADLVEGGAIAGEEHDRAMAIFRDAGFISGQEAK